MASMDGTWRTGRLRDALGRRAVLQTCAASIGLLLVVVLFMSARRATGAVSSPLPPLLLVLTAGVLLAWAWVVRSVCRTGTVHLGEMWLVGWGPSIVLWLAAVACSWPFARPVDWIVWLAVVAGDWFVRRSVTRPASRSSPVKDSAAKKLAAEQEEEITQQLTRVRMADGRELIRGTLAARFEPGARHATLYVGFCPPLERLPQVEAEAVAGPDARVKFVQVLHSGTQLEVQLARAAGDRRCVTIELVAAEPEDG